MAQQRPQDAPTRRLRVTACEAFRTFTDRRSGRQRHVYKVRAETPEGRPVSERLRAFDQLPVDGQLRDYRIRADHHETYGTSYVLSLPGGLTPRVEDLERRVEAIGQRVHRLEQSPAGANGQPATARLARDPH